MKTWFLNNLGLKIISLMIATVVWWLVHEHIEERLYSSGAPITFSTKIPR